MEDVPYCSYFNCEEHIKVTRQGENKCRYVTTTVVIFNKKTMMMGTLISRTFADFNEDYKVVVVQGRLGAPM